MKYCEHCDEQYPSEYSFCKTCGNTLVQFAGNVRVCPDCGTGSPEAYSFCQACGHSLRTAGLASGLRATGFQLAAEDVNSAPLPATPAATDDDNTDPLPDIEARLPPIVAPFESLRPNEPPPLPPRPVDAPIYRGSSPEVSYAPSVESATVTKKGRSGRLLLVAAACVLVAGVALSVGGALWVRSRGFPGVETPTSPANSGPPVAPPGMVYVPGGSLLLGTDSGDEFERPAHKVTLEPFFIDVYEVTCEEYARFAAETKHPVPARWKGGKPADPKLPVTGVNWDDAVAYAKWAGKRLPTEAEWELAARGNEGRKYAWGNDWNPNAANAGPASAKKLVAVGSHPEGVSAFGAHDMIGNAWEWTSTDLQPYPKGRISYPEGGPRKVIRGGCWRSAVDEATGTYRGAWYPRGNHDFGDTGFRCVKDLTATGATSEAQP
jgi:formylglycine-generating enzyme required for sulfatase activity